MITKERLILAINKMPEKINIEEVVEELVLLSKIEQGLNDVEAGVLRSKFNIKWGIDRGKNPPGSHWGKVRDNDLHKNLEEKREARGNKL